MKLIKVDVSVKIIKLILASHTTTKNNNITHKPYVYCDDLMGSRQIYTLRWGVISD